MTTPGADDPSTLWIRPPRGSREGPRRLIVLPAAGAGVAAYHRWPSMFPDDLEVCPVCLPGRERRLREPPFTRLPPLRDALVDALVPWCDRPFALLGHSMGGLLAFEAALELRRRGERAPSLLVVAGRRAPHRPPRSPPLHPLDDDAFVAEVDERFGGMPRALLDEPELLALVLPVLRADFEVIETYEAPTSETVDCPLLALAGREDTAVASEDIAAWERHTTGTFEHRVLEGGHFFVQSAAREIAALVDERLPVTS